VRLAVADEIMFLRPQSLLLSPADAEPIESDSLEERSGASSAGEPIAALLDGVPVQAHRLLRDRLILDDPDDLQARAIVSRRFHGTAMASLILHGDLNAQEPPLSRPLYIRPLMLAPEEGSEQTDNARLLIDTVYRAVLRMKGSEGEEAAAPSVFLVNFSMGDLRRPFTRFVSPLARLLDFLSARYGILFLVSAGNVTAPLTIPDLDNWTTFQSASPELREKAVLTALNAAKHERTILSPAESLNALTIGAHHHDHVTSRVGSSSAVDPFEDHLLPNVSSGLGLGHRRAIKPEIYFPGGREHVHMKNSGGGVEIRFGSPQRLYGLDAAAPDPSQQGRLDCTALSDGTSSATALATRAAHRIFDALMDKEGGSLLADIDREFYAVVVKTLLVHRARWNDKADLLKDICGPSDTRRHVERSENASRFMGFGVPVTDEAIECAPNRATLVGYGMLSPNQAHSYRIPLPACLERVTDPRSLTVTIAWFSPIKPSHQSYRCVKLEAAPLRMPIEVLGVERLKHQPADPTVKRGTLFHEHFCGSKAVPFIDDGHLGLRVWCKEDAGGIKAKIRYGIAVTIEAETAIPIYDEIQQSLRITLRPQN
jgi:Subtilase family